MRSFRRRVESLERLNAGCPTFLTMADGSVVTIDGKGDYMLRLLAHSCDATGATLEQRRQLNLIRQSVHIDQKGGGLMCELVRALTLSPHNDADEPDDPGKLPPPIVASQS